MSIANTIIACIGNTPIVRLQRLTIGLRGEVFVKLESHNPLGSVKDRIGIAMIEAAERDGTLRPGMTIMEATSGNTGISLAYVGVVKGYPVTLIMPETMSVERQRLLQAFGATLILTPGHEGMIGSVNRMMEIERKQPDCFLPRQFENPANPDIHYHTTGVEILKDLDGSVDLFVTSIGTGGTITGVGRRLREANPGVTIIAVEPAASPLLSGGDAGPHRIQGIGANFIPPILDRSLLDEVLQVSDDDAAATTRRLAREEGIFCGVSAGANVWAALQIAARPTSAGKRIVTTICDTGERYLSTWLFLNP